MTENETDAVEEPDEDEHTVMVDRSAADEDEHTVVVKRAAPRAAEGDAGTEDEDDHTVVVDRKGAKPSLPRPPSSKRRRGIAAPPVPEGFAPRAVDAIGPNAEVDYSPRALPDLPAEPEAPAEGPAATRAAAPFMPSVLRRGEHTARLTVIVFAATCVVSAVGLTLIAVLAF